MRSVLDDCGGIVRWGGDEETPYVALFHIDTPPAAVAARPMTSPLGKAAGRLRTWNQAPGMGAGAAA